VDKHLDLWWPGQRQARCDHRETQRSPILPGLRSTRIGDGLVQVEKGERFPPSGSLEGIVGT
jgi:hypothetical protein